MTESRATNVVWHAGRVRRDDRRRVLGHGGCTIWMTGLSGSGKSTVAVALEELLIRDDHLAYRLDGDNIRHGLNRNLGFSAEDRSENIRRIGEVARLFADAGVITIASFISPYRADRALVRAMHDEASLPFFEVFVDVPLDVAESRDPKGLYQRARAGEITGFTGIDDPYESPTSPEIALPTHEWSVDRSAQAVVDLLVRGKVLPSTST